MSLSKEIITFKELDKIVITKDMEKGFIWDKKVKEFIFEIKDILCQRQIKNKPCGICIICKTIDFEAGEKLI